MMLFNKLLQAVPILSFSVMRICQSGCFRLTLIQASIRRSYPFCSLYLPMLMILFSRQELPFSGEKGKKFGMTQAFFTSFQLSASCCVRTTSASSFLQPPPVSFSNAVRFACMGIPVVPSDAGYECMVWLYGILLFLRFHHPVVSENPILGPMC